jgi:hypothetical protein
MASMVKAGADLLPRGWAQPPSRIREASPRLNAISVRQQLSVDRVGLRAPMAPRMSHQQRKTFVCHASRQTQGRTVSK